MGQRHSNVQNNIIKNSLNIEEVQEKEKWLLQTYNQNQAVNTGISSELKQYVDQTISNGGVIDYKSSQQQEEQSMSTEMFSACNLWSAYYNPGFWNDPYSISGNNCYNYASNSRTHTFAQPGRAHGCNYTIGCSSVHNAAQCDGLTDTCGSNATYLVALVIWPEEDYHWYHWHGVWF